MVKTGVVAQVSVKTLNLCKYNQNYLHVLTTRSNRENMFVDAFWVNCPFNSLLHVGKDTRNLAVA